MSKAERLRKVACCGARTTRLTQSAGGRPRAPSFPNTLQAPVITENSVHASPASVRALRFPLRRLERHSADGDRTLDFKELVLVACKDGRGGPAERWLFARSEMSGAMPAFQVTNRRGAGIGGVIPRPEESLPRAPVPAVPLPGALGSLCPRRNAYLTADSRKNSCAEFDATISHSTR
jgi:hypothetical protein